MRSILVLTALIASLVSQQALAAKQAAYCQLLDKEGAVITGSNTQKVYPIASVSKLFTAYWAVTKLGAYYRYETVFHVVPLANGFADLHIQGSKAPYFAREQLQYIISELNKLGVKKIRTLTFDENFAYLNQVRSDAFAAGHYSPGFPDENRVKIEIKQFFDNVSAKYVTTKNKAKDRSIPISEQIAMSVQKIEFQSAQAFLANSAFRQEGVRHLVSRSVPLHRLLKEMNRNSNNYAANLIFEDLGGASRFNDWIQKQLDITDKQAIFYNGSGDSHDFDGDKKMYNSATCEVVLALISSLKKSLEMQELKLQNVIAVAGADTSDESSTVSDIYENDTTENSLMAKTGTVDPAISLAGVASTEQGEVYFGYIYSTNGSRSDWRSARNKIKSALLTMYDKYGGAATFDYNYKRFLSFDDKSALFEKAQPMPVVPAEPSEIEQKQTFAELFRATNPRPEPNFQTTFPMNNWLKMQQQWKSGWQIKPPMQKPQPPAEQKFNLGGNK